MTKATRSEHGKPTITFSKLVDKLQQHYGSPAPLPSADPLELVIGENIAYLASDKRRAEAFATLKQTIGTHPEQILAAEHSALAAIGKAGILQDVSAEKLLTIAKLAYEEFGSDLRTALKMPLPQVEKSFEEIPQHRRSRRGEDTLVHPFVSSDGANHKAVTNVIRSPCS
jgi:endonuclease III